jgi:predicted CXXCH cytochrome family protein
MTFRIRQIDYTADHRRVVRDRIIEKDALSIGRDAANDIHLPDLAIDPQHAVLGMAGPARITVKALGTLGFEVDGRRARDAAIDPVAGAELRFGSHRIGLRRDEDGAILIEVENEAAAGALPDPAEDKSGFSLHRRVHGKRAAAWSAALAILLMFLAWPIWSHLSYQAPAAGVAATAVHGDKAWNPGALSLAHQGLSNQCQACHVKPFQSVRNETCQTCHKDTHDHADPARLAAAHGNAGLGQAVLRRIGAAFGREGQDACTGCHVEHQGKRQMAAPAQQFCADCHATLRDRLEDTRIGNAADFGTAHPQFAASVVANAESRTLKRVLLDGKAREDGGLVFSHRVHLDSGGGVARMARSLGTAGYGKALDCASCHQPSPDGVSFRRVSMEQNCEACHSLAYAKAGATVLRLRHGDLSQAVADVRRAGTPSAGLAARGRPGQFSGRIYHADFNPAHGAGADPLAPGGLCGECHVRVMRQGRPAVQHVTLVDRYMQKGWFDHSAHTQQPCTGCHVAARSDQASDVLLPGIATCRTCHLGADAAAPKVASSCAMCHVFHASAGAPPFTRRRAPSTLAEQSATSVPLVPRGRD